MYVHFVYVLVNMYMYVKILGMCTESRFYDMVGSCSSKCVLFNLKVYVSAWVQLPQTKHSTERSLACDLDIFRMMCDGHIGQMIMIKMRHLLDRCHVRTMCVCTCGSKLITCIKKLSYDHPRISFT